MKKKMAVVLFIFSLIAPAQFAVNYVVSLANCVVDYGSEWSTLTVKTAKCAWTKATFQGVA